MSQLATKWVYDFGGGASDGDASMKNLLGGKGANLAEMSKLGLPVPPGFTITTEVCTVFYKHKQQYPAELEAQVSDALRALEGRTEKKFGDVRNPLLVSVRSGSPRLHAGHDGHGPEPRPQRPDGRRPGQALRRPALRLSTAIAASSRCIPTSC